MKMTEPSADWSCLHLCLVAAGRVA